MLIAQISDPHIQPEGRLAYGRVDTVAALSACVQRLLALDPQPDVLLITGDMVERGSDAEYALLRGLLAPLTLPCLIIPGNHDDRAAMRRAFSEPAWDYLRQGDEFIQYTVTLGGLRFVALDTLVPGEGRGKLCGRRLQWLDERLSQDSTPTIVMLHHPPFAIGIDHMDRVGLEGADALEAIIRRHPHVERLLSGHVHRPIQVRFGGTLASSCPSPALQVALDLRSGGPDCFVLEPPGFQLHLWREGRLISHTAVMGDFAGPYPFRGPGLSY
jgi:3',5'-cyclic AMP phosphodiesterase CpdA